MCGINGLCLKRSTSKRDIEGVLDVMNNLIYHRGPDEDGNFSIQKSEYSVGMSMRRLSIIDLETGKQPIFSEDKSKVIVFNGEIYNYKELKVKLEDKGIQFKTSSDTEVILKLYEEYGTSSFGLLDGMFAFSIYDQTLDKIIIARDYFGEKPLYYTNQNGAFYWGSELKSIIKVIERKQEISKHGLNLYFQLTYIPAPYTIYDQIFKLEANKFLTFDCTSLEMNIKEIEQDFTSEVQRYNKKEIIKKNHDLVFESVLSRSVSDVPIGTFLSGGVDSSITTLCLANQTDKKIDTFSIGFEKKRFDESDKARTVAKLVNSNHHEFIISEKDLSNDINHVLLNYDEPFADSSALATYFVSKKTSEHVKVALTGDGGDEVYGGYNKYYIGKINKKYTSIVPSKLHDKISNSVNHLIKLKNDNRGYRFKLHRLMKAINYDNDFYYNIISLGFQQDEINSLLNDAFFKPNPLKYYKSSFGKHENSLSDFRNIDKKISLEGDMLVKVDRASMLSSIECRAPFLNKKLWNFTSHLPENYLLNGWDKKHLLKESFKKYFPKGFLNKSKKGFQVPVGDWLRTSLRLELLHYTEKQLIEKQNIFNFMTIEKLVSEHVQSKVDNTYRVWTFYCFQKWYFNIYNK
tara:strand:+ start:9255 stop:11150 length:1896 start_codon:yes stop_codon:yes gene_type:complete